MGDRPPRTHPLFDGPDRWQEILDLVLCVLFSILFIVTVSQLLKYMMATRRGPSSPYFVFQRTFYSVCVFVTMGRAFFFVFEPLLLAGLVGSPWFGHLDVLIYCILSTLPGFLYFSAYILLVFYWAQIFHFAHDRMRSMPNYKPWYILVNMVVYTGLIVVYSLFYWKTTREENTKTYLIALFCLDGGVNLCAGLAFVLYGGVLYWVLREAESVAMSGRHRVLRKVGWATLLCTFSFFCRALFIIMQVFYCDNPPYCMMKPAVYFLFFVLLEFLPTVLMLIMFNNIPKRKEERPLLSASPDDMEGGSIHYVRHSRHPSASTGQATDNHSSAGSDNHP